MIILKTCLQFAQHSFFGIWVAKPIKWHRIILAICLLSLITACAGPPGVTKVTFPELEPPPAGPVTSKGYRSCNGDLISIKFVNNPELDADVSVRPDGKIALALIGEVPVCGLTMAELRTTISQKYQDMIARTHYGNILKEGDYFDLRFVYNPELNIGVIIQSDGKVSLPIVGEIQAAGLKPSELRQRLICAYARQIKDPDVALLVGKNAAKKIFAKETFISVKLAKAADQEVFVGGEVKTPKVVKFEGRLTTLQAIMQANGVKSTGDLSRVVVLRRGQFKQTEWLQTNLADPLKGDSIQNDLVLCAGDVVIVPKSGIAKLGQFVKQYIRDILPIPGHFSVNLDVLGTTVE